MYIIIEKSSYIMLSKEAVKLLRLQVTWQKNKKTAIGSTLYVGLARTTPPTNTNFRLTFLLVTRLQEALYEDLPA